ncbi:MAG: TraM recognition domain-containing protein [Bifidobacterium thermophilum]|nr:TraM recognition domain-containing protein [Bifidobacterium thermophilum]
MKWVSDRPGKQTIDARTTSQSKGQTGGFTINYQRTGRELMTPDELGVMPGTSACICCAACRRFCRGRSEGDGTALHDGGLCRLAQAPM